MQLGDYPRVVFRQVPNHAHNEIWQNRQVRKTPVVPGQPRIGRLAYYNNSKSASNSNVLQVILRDHGYERVESRAEEWAIFWCAGQIEPSELCLFQPHQKINKFPRVSSSSRQQQSSSSCSSSSSSSSSSMQQHAAAAACSSSARCCLKQLRPWLFFCAASFPYRTASSHDTHPT